MGFKKLGSEYICHQDQHYIQQSNITPYSKQARNLFLDRTIAQGMKIEWKLDTNWP